MVMSGVFWFNFFLIRLIFQWFEVLGCDRVFYFFCYVKYIILSYFVWF